MGYQILKSVGPEIKLKYCGEKKLTSRGQLICVKKKKSFKYNNLPFISLLYGIKEIGHLTRPPVSTLMDVHPPAP